MGTVNQKSVLDRLRKHILRDIVEKLGGPIKQVLREQWKYWR